MSKSLSLKTVFCRPHAPRNGPLKAAMCGAVAAQDCEWHVMLAMIVVEEHDLQATLLVKDSEQP